jgi:hypothetical protein
MKKIITAMAAAMLLINAARACEICGCGTGNYYMGLVPGFHHHFFGVRYQFKNYKTVMTNNPSQFSNDYFKTAELWGGINITKKLQLIGIVPISFIHQVSDDGTVNKNGFGDIAVMANYKVLDISSGGKAAVNQQLWLGTGIKLPTGKFAADINDPAIVALANTQTGSASTDFMLSGVYNLTINKTGINTNVNYKMNTRNKDKYAFGNRFSAGVLGYHTFSAGKIAINPNLGVTYENLAASKLQSQKIDMTGGNATLAVAGLEVSVKKVTAGFSIQLPVAQNFAEGQTKINSKGLLHVSFSF